MIGKSIENPDSGARPVHGRVFIVAASAMAGILVLQCMVVVLGVSHRISPVSVDVEKANSVIAHPVSVQNPVIHPDESATDVPTSPVISRTPAEPSVTTPVPSTSTASEASLVTAPVASPPIPPVPPTEVERPPVVSPVVPEISPAVEPKTTSRDSRGTLFSELASIARENVFSDGILERLMVTGSELRESGNMHGALNAYREVDKGLPSNPRVLSEIAATLDKMGLTEKADGCWEQVVAMDPVVAGSYLDLAKRQLHGEVMGESETESPRQDGATAKALVLDKEFKIGEIQVTEKASPAEGQQVRLKIVIDADPKKNPTATDLKLTVHFFDQGPSGEILPTTAAISYLYPTEPYDWQIDGTETIIVNYQQSPLSEEQERERNGNGKYYGYTVELYYRDRLQDKVAMPENLADIKFAPVELSAPVIAPNNALFPTPPPP